MGLKHCCPMTCDHLSLQLSSKTLASGNFRRPAESTNCRKLPLLFRLFAGVHVKITPYLQEFSKNHLYWTVLVTRPYWTVVSSIQDSCSLCDAPPVRATVSTGTPAARANRILSSNLWLSDSNLPKLIRMDDWKKTLPSLGISLLKDSW